jgi:hypothetical protein
LIVVIDEEYGVELLRPVGVRYVRLQVIHDWIVDFETLHGIRQQHRAARELVTRPVHPYNP